MFKEIIIFIALYLSNEINDVFDVLLSVAHKMCIAFFPADVVNFSRFCFVFGCGTCGLQFSNLIGEICLITPRTNFMGKLMGFGFLDYCNKLLKFYCLIKGFSKVCFSVRRRLDLNMFRWMACCRIDRFCGEWPM